MSRRTSTTPTGVSATERGMSREGRRKGGIIAISTSKREEENYTQMENQRLSRERGFESRHGMTEKDFAKQEAAFYAGPPKYRNPRLAAAAHGIPPRNFGPPKFSEEEIKKVRARREESGIYSTFIHVSLRSFHSLSAFTILIEKNAKIGMFTGVSGKPVTKRLKPLLGENILLSYHHHDYLLHQSFYQ